MLGIEIPDRNNHREVITYFTQVAASEEPAMSSPGNEVRNYSLAARVGLLTVEVILLSLSMSTFLYRPHRTQPCQLRRPPLLCPQLSVSPDPVFCSNTVAVSPPIRR